MATMHASNQKLPGLRSPCCGPCQGLECRTLEKNGASHETIPAELIIKGGLLAVQRQVQKISGKYQ